MNRLDDVRIFYALHRYKAKRITHTTLELVMICVAIDKVGLPITSDIIRTLDPSLNRSNLVGRLHLLGDKHILVLKRKRKLRDRFYEWVLHPAFKGLLA